MTNTKKPTTKRIPKKVNTEPLELPGEEWREIEGCPGYMISNMGRIKTFRNGRTDGYIMKPQVMYKKKYRFVCLARDGQKPYFMLIHRAVALAFIPKTDEKCNKIMHRDYNVANNAASNLKWVR